MKLTIVTQKVIKNKVIKTLSFTKQMLRVFSLIELEEFDLLVAEG
jgi:hypothetical protein